MFMRNRECRAQLVTPVVRHAGEENWAEAMARS